MAARVPFIVRFTAADLDRFSAASLDRNPLHGSDRYARKTPFGQRVAHGMLGVMACLPGLSLPAGTTPRRLAVDCKSALLLGVNYELHVVSQSPSELRAILSDGTATVTRIAIECDTGTSPRADVPDQQAAPRDEPRRLHGDDLVPGLAFRGQYAPARRAYGDLLTHLGIDRHHCGDGLLLTCLAVSYVAGMELPGESALLWSLNAAILPVRPVMPAAFAIEATHVNRRFAMVTSRLSLGDDAQPFARAEIVTTARPTAPSVAVDVHARGEHRRGTRALIVGASRGLGAALALDLVASGATVVGLFAKSHDDANELLAASRSLPGRLTMEQGDAGDVEWCRAVKRRVAGELGGLDLLICSAAPAIQPLRVEEACYERIRAYLDEGIGLVAAPMSAFLDLVSASRGRAIVISSSAVELPPPQWPHYVTLKAAAEGLVRGAAAHYPNVSFTIARPSRIRTDFSSNPLGLTEAEDAAVVARRILDAAARPAPDAGNVHVIR